MANANTEHSKKLRAKTAAARNKALIAQGVIKQISLTLPTEELAEFEGLAKELGLSRPRLLKKLIEFYKEHQE